MASDTPRLHLVRELADLGDEAVPPGTRRMSAADIEPLGRLLHAAYLGTVDYQGESESEAVAAVQATFDGDFGALVEEASLLVERDGTLLAASFVTLWEDRPLLAFAVTAPGSKGQGLSRGCVAASMRALALAGHRELHLYVTQTNLPALKAYDRLGFRPADDG